MSRRDTIIIAVLVNAALLMVLFITAIRSGKDEIPSVSSESSPQLAEKTVDMPASQEEFLNQYITPMPTLAEASILNESSELLATAEMPIAFPINDPIAEEISTAPTLSIKEEVSTAPSFVNVTVKKGDFLEKIAKANSTTVTAIMKANNLSSTQLKIGQVLKIPLSGSVAKKTTTDKPASKPDPQPASSSSSDYYVVKEGDNPWLIASRNHLKVDELLRLNQLDEQKAKKLRPGDRLRIR